MLIDTHTHLFWDSYKEDFDQVIQNALDAGVTTIINVGVDVEKSQEAAQLDSGQARMTFYSSIGIHPEEAEKFADHTEEKTTAAIVSLEEIFQSYPKKVIAVGEVGLDYFWAKNEETRNKQKKLLNLQINLAKKLNLPLLVHVRDDRSKNPQNIECWNEAINLTKEHFGIYHCYSGMGEITERILNETSFLISFAGNLTYPKNNYLRKACKLVPLNRIVLETDSPFLPPQSIRGKRNEPSSVKEIAQLVAELKKVSFEEVAKQTTQNLQRLLQFN